MHLCRTISLLIAVFAAVANAQTRPTSMEPTISIVVIGPGPAIYERYGHVGIRIQAPLNDLDVVFDWGNFDFGDPNFLGRFIKGDTRYWMQGQDGAAFVDHYAKTERRTVTLRTLNLTHDQTMRLIGIIRDQDDDQHRYYRYDYFRDNCSTRIRDLINDATGGSLNASKQSITPHSYRWHNRRLLRVGVDNMAILTGMELVTGPRVDAPLSEWYACYLPTLLGETLDRAKASDGGPLVRDVRVVSTSTRPGDLEPADALSPVWWMLPIGVVCGGVLLLLSRVWPVGFKLGATFWELIVLVGAVFMPSIILFTLHWVVAWDENFLQLTPLSLPTLWAIWRRSRETSTKDTKGPEVKSIRVPSCPSWTLFFPAAALALSVVGAVVTISHLTPQQNAPAVCLALPLHAAVVVGLRTLRKGPRHVPMEETSAMPT